MPFPVTIHRNVRIPMPDGVTLAADVFMPELPAGQRVPAIIEYTPYHKVNNAAYGPRASRYPYFASHGYAFVNVDIRGTGDSGGANDSITCAHEVSDGQEVIKWCASQPWSSGAVGMIGISYTAGVCYDAARQAPEALKAVVLCQMSSDWYDGMLCPGGITRPFAWENYAPLMAAYNFAPPAADLVGADWAKIWQQRLDGSTPWSIGFVNNLSDGPYWESRLLRGDAEKVKAATFLIGGWCDWYPDDFLRLMGKLQCPRRALIGPWTHNYPENAWPLPRLNDRYECLRWFDKYLKGIDTDPEHPVDRQPPITVFVSEFTAPAPLRRQDNGRFQQEAQWPPARAQEQRFALGSGGVLRAGGEGGAAPTARPGADTLVYRPDVGAAAGRYVIGQFTPGWGMSDDQRIDGALSLTYTLPALAEPLEIAGSPVVNFFYATGANTAMLSVKLCDVAPDGTSVLVTKGVRNLRGLLSGRPEREIEVPVRMQAMAYRFLAGHRIRVMVSGADFLNAWPTPEPYSATISHATNLVLPVVAGPDPALPAPSFKASDFAPEPPPAPQYSVTRDLIGARMLVNYTTRSGVGINRSEYTISIKNPAEASIVSDFEYPMDRPGLSVRVRSQCTTRSDAKTMHHAVQVEITVNGRAYWSKSWTAAVPRVDW